MAKTASKAMVRASGVSPAPKTKASRSVSVGEHTSVSIREISNGYVVCESRDGPKGYQYTETYSETKPKIEVPRAKAAKKR